ncbi:hypothetical protein ACFV2V_18890 [Streptomyces sp. NPDC059698]
MVEEELLQDVVRPPQGRHRRIGTEAVEAERAVPAVGHSAGGR